MMQAMKSWIAIGILSATASLAIAKDRPAIDLNVYGRIEINRTPAVVWPYIVEPNAWKPDRQLTHYAGIPGQLGEVFAIADQKGKIWFLVENVELVANQRRTIKLYTEDGRLLGFASWLLVDGGKGRTIVNYDVHAESLIPEDQIANTTSASLAAQKQQGYDGNKKRIDTELAELKRLVESK